MDNQSYFFKIRSIIHKSKIRPSIIRWRPGLINDVELHHSISFQLRKFQSVALRVCRHCLPTKGNGQRNFSSLLLDKINKDVDWIQSDIMYIPQVKSLVLVLITLYFSTCSLLIFFYFWYYCIMATLYRYNILQ